MEEERRRAPRFQFIAPAELVDATSGARTIAWVTDLGSRGCSLGVTEAARKGAALQLKIMAAKEFVEARATVVHAQPHRVGMVFDEVSATSSAVLQKWLSTAKFVKGRV
jgi:hypothetical protein